MSTINLEPEQTVTTATMNGRPQRKQLSDQLDRMDTIIDALAEGLPGAVQDAVRDGTQAAVKQVLIELLHDPEVRALVAGIAAKSGNSATPSSVAEAIPTAKAVTGPSLVERLRRAASLTYDRAASTAARVRNRIVEAAAGVRDTAVTLHRTCSGGRVLSVAVAVSLAVAVVATTNHAVAATVAGLASGIAAAAVHVGISLRKAFRPFLG